jgi:hypothetical protein
MNGRFVIFAGEELLKVDGKRDISYLEKKAI